MEKRDGSREGDPVYDLEGEQDTASTRSLTGSHFGGHDSSASESNSGDIVDVSIGEYDRRTANEGGLFQDVHVEYKILST